MKASEAPSFIRLLREFRASEGLPASAVTSNAVLKLTFSKKRKLAVHVARIGDEVVGFVSFRGFYEPSAGVSGIHLCDIFVADRLRRNGVGKALLDSVLHACVRSGGRFVWWTTNQNNAAAIKFFDRSKAPRLSVYSYTWQPSKQTSLRRKQR